MSTLFIILWMLLPFYTESIVFPGQDEGPLIAVTDFKASKMDIFDPSGGVNATVIEEINLEYGQAGACGIEFNYRRNMIYWTDVYDKKVYSLNSGGGDQEQNIILEGELSSPQGLAYDWIHNNLYVSDLGLNKILVIKPETGARKTLLYVYAVADLELDPRTGWLYWIAGWEDTAMLMKSTLDGQNQVVISSDLDRPMSLSLDYDEQKLYWTEIYPVNLIKSIRVDGEGQTIVHQPSSSYHFSPMYITVTMDYIYWTQGSTHRVLGRSKNNGGQPTRYKNLESRGGRNIQEKPFSGILAIDPRKQRESPSLCGDNNGGCSHFCLPSLIQSVTSYKCACPDGMNLMDDNSTCSAEVTQKPKSNWFDTLFS
ncbi:low-density lipoprotein receptor-related protein 6 [Patella vulgata]|uniref:low-density lipoprotein receptor-related protein 6 n=1 Tax=Patella vulgata TaxID=6465 RepID=UPI0024A8CFB4|nr:low-density lipoprotein receptor-related protein 6 [Patella vulgata]